ncbi:TPA: hypothetical protein ACMY2T_002136 [Legionella pneumophila]|uniref:hypothetical protein n=1 Tax=Legionella pneumophila TaxID=446 RepID=UPI001A1F28E5|nr:hypothetical protein [Legionella pneumophila]MCZ4682195.1 hypothetical protein [Legionella pneumophila]HAT1765741.1 hypothetical protein [Legionella pneumophila]HAT3973824.1 hypothetical protein [Legionella pneumophila]HAU0949075.1 hypothetical protein [Legionella pneumophila]HAU1288281.1 hypothetical protein [Legionella pneumophila]
MSIAKLCADHLRAISVNHGVKLKASHAHELVASFFGYKSKAALLSDNLSPIENIDQAKIFVLIPSSFIEERRKCLADLPPELPDTYTLGEEMFTFLAAKKMLVANSFASWKHLAEALTNEYLHKNGTLILPPNFGDSENARNIFNKPVYEFNPKIESIDNEVKLTVFNRYYGSSYVHFQPIDVVLTIKLQRIAGHFGYAKPEISLMDISNQPAR